MATIRKEHRRVRLERAGALVAGLRCGFELVRWPTRVRAEVS